MQEITQKTLRYYWKQIMSRKWQFVIMSIVATIVVLIKLLEPYFLKLIIDGMVENQEMYVIYNALIWLTVVYANEWIFNRIKNFLNINFVANVSTNIYNECFEYAQKHSLNFFNNNFTGSLVKRLNRLVYSFEGFFDRLFFDIGPLVIKTIIITIVLMWLNIKIGIAMVIWLTLFILFSYLFARYKFKYDLAHTKSSTKISGMLADTFTNQLNIKLFGAFNFENNNFQKLTTNFKNAKIKAWTLAEIADGIQGMSMISIEIIVFYLVIKGYEAGKLTAGDMVWIQSYLLQMFWQVWNLGRNIRYLYENLADAAEMIEIMNTKHEITDQKNAPNISITRGKIEFKNVSFGYDNQEKLIDNLTYRIKPSEKVALVGPSGAGKSTLIKLILRLIDVNSGEILIDSQNITQIKQDSLRSQISLVPQNPILFHRTILENIRYGRRDATDYEIRIAAKMANCHHFIDKFPDKYHTKVGERGVKLSGGERQRIAIARAILTNAPILILDEATSSLDSQSEHLIQEALENLMKQKTTLVIAHRLSTIMKMDRIIVIKNGKILEEGTHAKLIHKNSSLYKQLWDLQVGGFEA